ncbi:ATPase [Plantactinospora sp. GCM10030261]|uniref:ATPase n=1 Tax=Plantactinospora sp. GCM10030261 TaxID=3273420 RepID=UPI00360E7AF6
MEFSAVDHDRDRNRIASSLAELGDRLAHTAERVAADPVRAELSLVQAEIYRLRGLLTAGCAPPPVHRTSPGPAERAAADLLAQARNALLAAHEEARQVRDRAYEEAMQARRDFEAALYARRLREERADEILRNVVIRIPAEEPVGGPVPATRVAEAG